jgi:hypothetical protein
MRQAEVAERGDEEAGAADKRDKTERAVQFYF